MIPQKDFFFLKGQDQNLKQGEREKYKSWRKEKYVALSCFKKKKNFEVFVGPF